DRFNYFASLFGAAAAELDQRAAIRHRSGDLIRMLRQDLILSPRQVVLIDVTDCFEELRAELVVEILGKEMFGIGRKTAPYIVGEVSVPVALRQVMNDQTRRGIQEFGLRNQIFLRGFRHRRNSMRISVGFIRWRIIRAASAE